MMPEGATPVLHKPAHDETLIKAVVRARRWRRKIETGKAIDHRPCGAGGRDGHLCLPAHAAHLPGTGQVATTPGSPTVAQFRTARLELAGLTQRTCGVAINAGELARPETDPTASGVADHGRIAARVPSQQLGIGRQLIAITSGAVP
jgi:hypothetical protein